MDLNIYPLARHNDQDLHELAGLHSAVPPRRPARGRAPDRLILHFAFEGSALFTSEQTRQILRQLALTYYKTAGSVTSAMRAVAEALNQQLLERNLREAGSGRQFVGLLSMVVLREERVYIAQSGPVHAYHISAGEISHFHDPALARRGLGLGRNAPIYYSQVELKADDILLLSAQAPAGWTEDALQSLPAQKPENLHQQILAIAGPNLEAAMIQVRSGPGKIYQLKPKPIPAPAAEGSAAPAKAAPMPAVEEPEVSAIAEPFMQLAPPEIEPEPPEAPLEASETSAQATSPQPRPVSPAPSRRSSTASPEAPAAAKPRPRRGASLPSRALAKIGAAFLATLGAFASGLRSLLKRMLPDESIFTIPGPVMALIAITIPLVVVSVATVVYYRRGRAAQFEIYYAQAVQVAGHAQAQNDPQVRREAWLSVINFLDQADDYQRSPDADALRSSASQSLDALDLTTRLEFQPAIAGELPEESKITRIIATETELYLLDASQGGVLRAFAVARGYELDPSFQCRPGGESSQTIGPLLDIELLGKSSTGEATILGIDENGYTLICQPGMAPTFTTMAPPATGWGKPQAFTLSLDGMYVLDPQVNAVWYYANNDFSQPPELVFEEEVPPMADVIDLAVDRNELYLLHADGHLTQCTFSAVEASSTHCTEPAPYIDYRPGREGQAFASPPAFTQILSTQPPDPSLLILEPGQQSLYLFSLRLIFQRQYRPAPQPGGAQPAALAPASAFGIRPDKRVAFMAFGNQVSYAGLP